MCASTCWLWLVVGTATQYDTKDWYQMGEIIVSYKLIIVSSFKIWNIDKIVLLADRRLCRGGSLYINKISESYCLIQLNQVSWRQTA